MSGRKEEGPAIGGPQGPEGGHHGEAFHSEDGSTATDFVAQTDKRFATARARLALASYQLHIVDDGKGGSAYLVQRWDRSRTLADIDAVESFIVQATGQK